MDSAAASDRWENNHEAGECTWMENLFLSNYKKGSFL
jgi:hypothetical protein